MPHARISHAPLKPGSLEPGFFICACCTPISIATRRADAMQGKSALRATSFAASQNGLPNGRGVCSEFGVQDSVDILAWVSYGSACKASQPKGRRLI